MALSAEADWLAEGVVMGISTKKGDEGYTSLLGGERVPKYHLRTEAVGILDEANSLLGLARASARETRVKRIILQIQKDLFIIGAEVSSTGKREKAIKKTISEENVSWLDRLVGQYEEALSLPPEFVAFGQQPSASHMDVARASIRKVERMVVKIKSDGLIENVHLLQYLNRLSDLLFLLACFEEKEEEERRKIRRDLFSFQWSDPVFRKWAIIAGSIILALITVIFLLLAFHRPGPDKIDHPMRDHMQIMEEMHPQTSQE